MVFGGHRKLQRILLKCRSKEGDLFCVLLQNPLERRKVFRPWCAAIIAGTARRRRKKQRIGLIFCGSLQRKRTQEGLPGLCLGGHHCPQSSKLLIAGEGRSGRSPSPQAMPLGRSW
ncbi:hypothetical protein AAC387_Pa11g1375 [Persea americana]